MSSGATTDIFKAIFCQNCYNTKFVSGLCDTLALINYTLKRHKFIG
jgi:hypothetical protein